MKKLARFLTDASENKRQILVIGHSHADPDAIGCILALEEALEKLGAKVHSGVPKNLSKLAKSVLGSVGREVAVDPSADFDLAIVVDTSTLGQLDKFEEKLDTDEVDVVFIDHHRPSEEDRKKAKFYWVDEGATSTAEMVLKLLNELNVEPSPEVALLMLTGVISDTAHFRFANKETFRAVTELIDAGAEYRMAMDALKTPEDPSKRIAMLKAAQRSEIYKAYGRWIAFTEIGAFQSDAASMLLDIGADVAIAGGEDEGKVRISGRSRADVSSETNLHLGEFMSKLADAFDGVGGGHAGAAAMSAEGDMEEIKKEALKIVRGMLKPRKNDVSKGN